MLQLHNSEYSFNLADIDGKKCYSSLHTHPLPGKVTAGIAFVVYIKVNKRESDIFSLLIFLYHNIEFFIWT